MDYLNRCYAANFRVFVDGVARIVRARWYWSPPGAPMFPYSHCWGSQIYEDYLRWDEGGPIELEGKFHAPNDNPGYKAKCIVGEKSWWQTGNIPASALVNPPPLPSCCFEPVTKAIAGKAALGVCSFGYAVNYGWVRMKPRVELLPAGELVMAQELAGEAGLAVASSAYLLDGGRIVGRAGLTAAAKLRPVYGPKLRGKATISLTPAPGAVRRYELHGRAGLALVAGPDSVHPWKVAGLVVVQLGATGALTYAQRIDGEAPLAFVSAGELVYGPYLAGEAGLALESAGDMGISLSLAGDGALLLASAAALAYTQVIAGRASWALAAGGFLGVAYFVAGDAGLRLVAAGALELSLALAGNAALQLTSQASFVFQPSVTPGSSCAGAANISLGTTYGPFSQPATGVNVWFQFPGVAGTAYAVTVNTGGTPFWSGTITQGSCPNPATGLGSVQASGGTTNVTASITGPVYVKFTRTFGTGASYTIHVS